MRQIVQKSVNIRRADDEPLVAFENILVGQVRVDLGKARRLRDRAGLEDNVRNGIAAQFVLPFDKLLELQKVPLIFLELEVVGQVLLVEDLVLQIQQVVAEGHDLVEIVEFHEADDRLESELVEYFGLDIDDEVVVVLVVLELRANELDVVLVFGSF